MHVFVVALTAKEASPAQNRGLPTTTKKWKHSTRDTRHTPHTYHARHTEHSIAAVHLGILFKETEKNAPEKGLELSSTLGCPRNRTAAAVLYLWQNACTRGITQQQRPPALQIAGSDKKTPIDKKPEQYSADKLTHT